ncbi:MAG TPA: hypothetical protein VK636_22145 [Gemmatimonadaceae bacterium]|nr:hypothetical protein [Gemmatimonadaceae bacterium]
MKSVKNSFGYVAIVLAGLYGAIYGAVFVACVSLASLDLLATLFNSEGFSVLGMVYLIFLNGLVAIAGGFFGGWISSRATRGFVARLRTPDRSLFGAHFGPNRRGNNFGPLTIATGGVVFFVVTRLIATELPLAATVSFSRLSLTFIKLDEPLPVVVSLPLMVGTLIVAVCAAVWGSNAYHRRVLARAKTDVLENAVPPK